MRVRFASRAFSMIETMAAYQNYEYNMDLVEDLFRHRQHPVDRRAIAGQKNHLAANGVALFHVVGFKVADIGFFGGERKSSGGLEMNDLGKFIALGLGHAPMRSKMGTFSLVVMMRS